MDSGFCAGTAGFTLQTTTNVPTRGWPADGMIPVIFSGVYPVHAERVAGGRGPMAFEACRLWPTGGNLQSRNIYVLQTQYASDMDVSAFFPCFLRQTEMPIGTTQR